METNIPPKPNVSEVEKYLKKWKSLENYTLQEEALNKLFGLMPENKEISDVLLKTATLNDFYSTNIFSIYPVAKHILSISNIDNRLKSGDVTLVDEIKNVTELKRNFYSFATKYCSHHNHLEFPIYDSYVEKILCLLNKKYPFAEFKKQDLKEYSKFKEVLLKFREYFKLTKFDLKEIDQYLWLLGKEIFPKENKEVKLS